MGPYIVAKYPQRVHKERSSHPWGEDSHNSQIPLSSCAMPFQYGLGGEKRVNIMIAYVKARYD